MFAFTMTDLAVHDRRNTHLASCEMPDVRSIDVEIVSGFVTSCSHLKPRTLALVLCDLRCFLRYLAM